MTVILIELLVGEVSAEVILIMDFTRFPLSLTNIRITVGTIAEIGAVSTIQHPIKRTIAGIAIIGKNIFTATKRAILIQYVITNNPTVRNNILNPAGVSIALGAALVEAEFGQDLDDRHIGLERLPE
jgi:hypothetical protein